MTWALTWVLTYHKTFAISVGVLCRTMRITSFRSFRSLVRSSLVACRQPPKHVHKY